MELPVFLHLVVDRTTEGDFTRMKQIMAAYGGVIIATYEVEYALNGRDSPECFIVLSFPSRASIQTMFADTQFRAIIPWHESAFEHIKFFVTSERL